MMSRKSSARTAGPLSMGFPEPLNTRPARKKNTFSVMSTTRGRGGVCGAVEDNVTQHVFRHGRPQDVPRELTAGFLGVDARSTFEHL